MQGYIPCAIVMGVALSVGCMGRVGPPLTGDEPADASGGGEPADAASPLEADAKDASAPSTDAARPPHMWALQPDVGLGIECATTEYQTQLGCTGLYVNWPNKELAPGVKEFEPAFHLWSDGADKRRFILLPPGTQIDTSNMDEWIFPPGTKLWKEFRVKGKLIETRYLEKRMDGSWVRATYAWSYDEKQADELIMGAVNALGTGFDIPTRADCATCHNGRIDGVLGFEAVGLSDPRAKGLTLQALVYAGLLTNPPVARIRIPGDVTAAAALGYLHANCGTACHNTSPSADAAFTGLHMRLNVDQLASVQATDTWRTAVNVRSTLQPVVGLTFLRITPRNVGSSLIPYRDGRRDDGTTTGIQMPPLGTRLVDSTGLFAVTTWINAM